jgi:hypothetical protein
VNWPTLSRRQLPALAAVTGTALAGSFPAAAAAAGS